MLNNILFNKSQGCHLIIITSFKYSIIFDPPSTFTCSHRNCENSNLFVCAMHIYFINHHLAPVLVGLWTVTGAPHAIYLCVFSSLIVCAGIPWMRALHYRHGKEINAKPFRPHHPESWALSVRWR